MEKSFICVLRYGGRIRKSSDGTISCDGGEAHLIDVNRNMHFDQFKSEVSEIYEIDLFGFVFKYIFPSNRKTLITISNNRDLRRMVDVHPESSSPEIFLLVKELVVPNNANAIAGDDVAMTPSRASTNSIIESSNAVVCHDGSSKPLTDVWDKKITGVGQTFKDARQFRDTLRKYAAAKSFAYKFVHDDSTRITAKCKEEGCPWRIHASIVGKTKAIKIKVMKDVHTCKKEPGEETQPTVTKYVVADLVKHKLRDNPDCTPAEIIRDISRDHGLKLTYSQAWRAKGMLKEQFVGKDADSYKQLPKYCEDVVESNPGSMAVVMNSDEGHFQRLFISYFACIHGFLSGCRPLLLLDSAPLKSRQSGILLFAASVDANDGIFPVSFAIVEQEVYNSWHWFLLQLRSAFPSSLPRLTFVSDIHKGLKEAIAEVFEDSYQAYSVSYLAKSLMEEIKGSWSKAVRDVVTNLIQSAARTRKRDEFYGCIDSIRSISSDAADWIMAIDSTSWTNLHFKGSRYNHVSSNINASFDSWLPKTCDMPILKFVDNITNKTSELMNSRLEDANGWMTKLTPTAEEKIRKEAEVAPSLCVSTSSPTVFEVLDEHVNIVDLEKWRCSCLFWNIEGLPCRHAIASLNRVNKNIYDYCQEYFTVEYYKSTYSVCINPIMDGNSILPTPEVGTIVASLATTAAQVDDVPGTRRGRPKRKCVEVQEAMQETIQETTATTTTATKLRRTTLCSQCKQPGHNKSTCKALV